MLDIVNMLFEGNFSTVSGHSCCGCLEGGTWPLQNKLHGFQCFFRFLNWGKENNPYVFLVCLSKKNPSHLGCFETTWYGLHSWLSYQPLTWGSEPVLLPEIYRGGTRPDPIERQKSSLTSLTTYEVGKLPEHPCYLRQVPCEARVRACLIQWSNISWIRSWELSRKYSVALPRVRELLRTLAIESASITVRRRPNWVKPHVECKQHTDANGDAFIVQYTVEQ